MKKVKIILSEIHLIIFSMIISCFIFICDYHIKILAKSEGKIISKSNPSPTQFYGIINLEYDDYRVINGTVKVAMSPEQFHGTKESETVVVSLLDTIPIKVVVCILLILGLFFISEFFSNISEKFEKLKKL